jgi:plastocyanin
MTSRWLICSSLFAAFGMPSGGGTVTGKVELRDSRDPAVKKRGDYSGVVITLKSTTSAPIVVAGKATITQKNKRFTPHVLAVPVGTLVDFPNFDPIFHNAFSSYSGQVFDIGLYPPGTTRSVRFSREGVVRVFCNIHASMSAIIVVVASPFFTVTNADGSFKIPEVPEGEYAMSVFHERASEMVLRSLEKRVAIGGKNAVLPPIVISEAGYLSIPHKNKYGHDYPDANNNMVYASPIE